MCVPAGHLLDPRWLRPVTTDVPRRPGGRPRCGSGAPPGAVTRLIGGFSLSRQMRGEHGWASACLPFVLPTPNSKALLSVPAPKNQSRSGPPLGQR